MSDYIIKNENEAFEEKYYSEFNEYNDNEKKEDLIENSKFKHNPVQRIPLKNEKIPFNNLKNKFTVDDIDRQIKENYKVKQIEKEKLERKAYLLSELEKLDKKDPHELDFLYHIEKTDWNFKTDYDEKERKKMEITEKAYEKLKNEEFNYNLNSKTEKINLNKKEIDAYDEAAKFIDELNKKMQNNSIQYEQNINAKNIIPDLTCKFDLKQLKKPDWKLTIENDILNKYFIEKAKREKIARTKFQELISKEKAEKLQKSEKQKKFQIEKIKQERKRINEIKNNVPKVLDERETYENKKKDKIKKREFLKADFRSNETDSIIQKIREIEPEINNMKANLSKINKEISLTKQKNIVLDETLKKLTKEVGVIISDENNYIPLGLVPNTNIFDLKKDLSMSESNGYSTEADEFTKSILKEKRFEEMDILEKVMFKTISNDMTLEDLFRLIDSDNDGIITLLEIKEQLPKLNMDFSKMEIIEFTNIIDKNSDSVIDMKEFFDVLFNKYEMQKKILNENKECKIKNPNILNERILHLNTLGPHLMKLINEEDQRINELQPVYNKYLENIQNLEQKLVDLQSDQSSHKVIIMNKIKNLRLENQNLEFERIKFENLLVDLRERKLNEKVKIELNLDNLEEDKILLKEKKMNLLRDFKRLEALVLGIEAIEKSIEEKDLAKNEKLQKISAYFASQQKMSLFEAEETLLKIYSEANVNQAATCIQKTIKSRIDRHKTDLKKKYKNMFKFWKKITFINPVVNILNNCYIKCNIENKNLFLKKITYFVTEIKEKREIEAILVLDESYAEIKEKEENLASNSQRLSKKEEEKKPLFLDIKRIDEKQPSEKATPRKKLFNLNFNIQSNKNKTDDEKTEKTEEFDIKKLEAAFIIQRNYRYKKISNLITSKEENYNKKILNDQKDICHNCNENFLEIICKLCKNQYFCKNCFNDIHKKMERKNHKYVEYNPLPKRSDDELEERIVCLFDQSILEKIAELFKIKDFYKFGLIHLGQLREILENPDFPFSKDELVIREICFYCIKNFSGEANYLDLKIRKIKKNIYSNTQIIIDYIQFLSFFRSVNDKRRLSSSISEKSAKERK